jgi:hypothetical protein
MLEGYVLESKHSTRRQGHDSHDREKVHGLQLYLSSDEKGYRAHGSNGG